MKSATSQETAGYGFAYFAWMRLANGYRLEAGRRGLTFFMTWNVINGRLPMNGDAHRVEANASPTFNLPVAIYGEGFIGMASEHYERVAGGSRLFAGMAARSLTRVVELEGLLREARSLCSDGNAANLYHRITEALDREPA